MVALRTLTAARDAARLRHLLLATRPREVDAEAARLQRLGGQEALVMPYVHMATEDDWERPEVAAAARAAVGRIDELGLVYEDVRRRHLGLYRDDAGVLRAVFVDLSSVVPRADVSDGDIQGLDDMLASLEIS